MSVKDVPNSKINLLPPLIDSAGFIGSGLLATSYLTTWINSPMSSAGVVFASLLNAGSIYGAQKISKTNESNSSLYKIAVTLGAVGMAAIALPHLAAPLANRLGIITGNAAFQMGAFHLCIKASLQTLSLLGLYFLSLKMPTAAIEVQEINEWDLKKYHSYFATEEGKKKWIKFNQEIQLAFLAHFEKNKLSIDLFPMDRENLTDENFIIYHETIWNYFIAIISSKRPGRPVLPNNIMELIKYRSFHLDLSPPAIASPSFFSTLDISNNTTEEIANYTKNQALWKMGIMLSGSGTLPQDSIDAYVSLFIKHSLSLPEPKSIDEIENLSDLTLRAYYSYYNDKYWEELPLNLQNQFNKRFLSSENIDDSYYLEPNSVDSIEAADEEIIRILHQEALDPYGIWEKLPIAFQNALNLRFFYYGLPQIDDNEDIDSDSREDLPPPESIEKIRDFSDETLGKYLSFYEMSESWGNQLSLKLQYEFLKRFANFLNSTSPFYLIPDSLESIKKATREITLLLHKEMGEGAMYRWKQLTGEWRAALNQKFVEHGLDQYS